MDIYQFTLDELKVEIEKEYDKLFKIILEPYLNEIQELETRFGIEQKNGEDLDEIGEEISQRMEKLIEKAQMQFVNISRLKNYENWEELIKKLVIEQNMDIENAGKLIEDLKHLRKMEIHYYYKSVKEEVISWKDVPIYYLLDSKLYNGYGSPEFNIKQSNLVVSKMVKEFEMPENFEEWTINELAKCQRKTEKSR